MNNIIKAALLCVALAAPAAAGAQEANSQSNSNSTANSQSGSLSAAQSNQRQNQGQAQGQDQGQSQQSVSASNQGQSQGNANEVGNVNVINFPSSPTETKARLTYAPALSLGVMNPTTPCFSTYQGGVSGMGFGVAIGGGVVDDECTRRENARMLSGLGENAAAVSLLCGNPEVAKRAVNLCKVAEAQAMAPTAVAAPMKQQKPEDASAPKSSKHADPAPPKSSKPDDPAAPKSSKPSAQMTDPAVKEYTDGNGKTYRWTTGGWQPVADTLPLRSPPNAVDGKDILVQVSGRG
jgi:hypothetical protein